MQERKNTRMILAEALSIVQGSVFPGSIADRVAATGKLLSDMVLALDAEIEQSEKELDNAPEKEFTDREGVEL